MSIKGKIIYILISSILAICFINNKEYVLLLCELLLCIICFKKFDIKMVIITIVVFSFFCVYRTNKIDDSKNNTYIEEVLTIKEVKPSYIIASHDYNYIIYLKDTTKFNTNNKIEVKGMIKSLQKDLDIDVFEFVDYLKNKRVYYQIETNYVNIVESTTLLSEKIVNVITYNLKDESKAMTKMLLFNDKYIDEVNYENLKQINALHLFVVSGFHISFLFSLIKIIIKNEKISTVISFLICGFYVYLLNFSIGALRAFLSTLFIKLFNKYINQLDAVSLSGIITLLIEPLNVFNYSFIMSYLMTCVIVLSSKTLKKYSKITQALIISVISFLTMIPIQLQLNYELNFISLLSNVILSYVVILIFVLCIVGIIFSFFNGNVFGIIYEGFNKVIEKIASLNTSIVFGTMNKPFIIIYYIFLFLLLISFEKGNIKKMMINATILLTILIGLYNRQYFLFYQKVTFLNVYQGDCVIIQDSFTGKVMLIDTGGLTYYDIAEKKIMPYLNFHGIRQIDLVVITHDDYDHNGALESLKEKIPIKKIVNYYVDNVELGKINLTNLNVFGDNFSNTNDKSIVLYGNVCGKNFLFTGDISKDVEQLIISKYNDLDVDVLKVAHHGSKSSTSEQFIKAISPEYAIISVGENNNHGHPHKDVLNILIENEVLIYRTDKDGTIRFIGKIFGFYFVETAK